jgi:4-diphosphocytidyl-2-C-methyl-D-erythritol kinase
MSGTLWVSHCPAKINLALRVVDRRPDGFHDLDTVFQTIDLWDRIEARPAPTLRMTCNDPNVPVDERNLVLRAALAVREAAGLPPARGADFRLEKSIPAQGGLGGGSSDAAGAIRLAVSLWAVDLAPDTLERIAASLGADVPFFLTGGTARGRGRGDRIEALPPLAEHALVLGFPPFGVSTAEVFAEVRHRLTLPGNGVSLPRLSAYKWPGDKDFSFAVNDLESVVFPRWPSLKSFRDALRAAGARAAMLSGSGSTVFGVFTEPAVALEAAERVGRRFEDWTVLATRTVESGPRVERVAPGGNA